MRTFASSLATNRSFHVIGILGLGTSLLLAGCGAGMQDVSSSIEPVTNVPGPTFHGNAHGGPNPIVGATVKLYATGSSSPGTATDGYGVGTFLAEAAQEGTSSGQDTNANGDFIFNTTYTCPAKQFAYVVVSGGNPGGGVNTSAVLVAAVGRCEDLSSSTLIYVNELTTIAAAYALGHFSTVTCGGVTCTTGNMTATNLAVGIGAPITANSQKYTDANGHSAGCISNTFYGTTACPQTVTAALYHAFLNANNLMPTTTYSQSAPLNVAIPGTTSNPALVPQRLLNSMGNALVACVNSTGASSSACGIVFGAGTLGGVAPTNTFQAMVNIAQNPTMAGTSNPNSTPTAGAPYTPTTFFAAAGSTTNSYGPTLTGTSPPDLEVAIYYPTEASQSTAQASNDFGYVSATQVGLYQAFHVGLDINDNAYIGVQNSTSSSTLGAIVTINSAGTLVSNPVDSTAYTQIGFPSPDGLGNIYSCDTSSTTTYQNPATLTVEQWPVTTGGVVTLTPTATMGTGSYCDGMAVDRSGNVWLTNPDSAGSTASFTYNVYELVPPLTTATTCTGTSPTTAGCNGVMSLNNLNLGTTYYGADGIAVDPNQNIWVGGSNITNPPAVAVLQNTGSLTSPTYAFQSGYTGSGGSSTGTSKVPATATTAVGTGGEANYGMVMAYSASASGGYVGWTGSPSSSSTACSPGPNPSCATNTSPSTVVGVEPFSPTLTSAEVSSLSAGTYAGAVGYSTTNAILGLNVGVADGLGNVYWANQGGNQMMETTAQGTNIGLFPCALKPGGTGCTTTSPNSPRGIAMDSTGTAWLASGTAGMFEIIGLGWPTWPQLSLGKVGRP